jgi:hypothetical protein
MAQAAGQNSYNGTPVVQIDSKRGDWDKNRNWKKRRHSKNRHHGDNHRRYDRNDADIALGIFGLAAGAMLGAALSQPHYYGADVDAYCSRKYTTYKPWTGTFTGFDGREHPCRYP